MTFIKNLKNLFLFFLFNKNKELKKVVFLLTMPQILNVFFFYTLFFFYCFFLFTCISQFYFAFFSHVECAQYENAVDLNPKNTKIIKLNDGNLNNNNNLFKNLNENIILNILSYQDNIEELNLSSGLTENNIDSLKKNKTLFLLNPLFFGVGSETEFINWIDEYVYTDLINYVEESLDLTSNPNDENVFRAINEFLINNLKKKIINNENLDLNDKSFTLSILKEVDQEGVFSNQINKFLYLTESFTGETIKNSPNSAGLISDLISNYSNILDDLFNERYSNEVKKKIINNYINNYIYSFFETSFENKELVIENTPLWENINSFFLVKGCIESDFYKSFWLDIILDRENSLDMNSLEFKERAEKVEKFILDKIDKYAVLEDDLWCCENSKEENPLDFYLLKTFFNNVENLEKCNKFTYSKLDINLKLKLRVILKNKFIFLL